MSMESDQDAVIEETLAVFEKASVEEENSDAVCNPTATSANAPHQFHYVLQIIKAYDIAISADTSCELKGDKVRVDFGNDGVVLWLNFAKDDLPSKTPHLFAQLSQVVQTVKDNTQRIHRAITYAALTKNETQLRASLRDVWSLPPRTDLPLSARAFLEKTFVEVKEKEVKQKASYLRRLRAERNRMEEEKDELQRQIEALKQQMQALTRKLALADSKFHHENERKEKCKSELKSVRRELAETIRERDGWTKRLRHGDIESFDCNDVLNFLREIGLGHATAFFERAKIDGSALLELNEENFDELGLSALADKKHLEISIAKVQAKTQLHVPALPWSVSEVEKWVNSLGFDGKTFVKHNIDGDVLITLFEEDLINKLGMDNKSADALMSHIHELREKYWPENTFTTSVSSRSHSGGYTTNTLSSSPQRLSLPSITGIGSSSGSMRSPRSKSPLRALARRNSSPPPPSHYQLYNPCKKCTLNEICTAMVPCGHSCLCSTCAAATWQEGSKQCPVCNEDFTYILTIRN